MSAVHLGFYNTSSTRTHVRFQFSTHAQTGANVAPNSAFEAADIRIYKATDGAAFSATQRSSANGITMTSPFDSGTGIHDVDIDLTDNTDASFYVAGFYSIWLWPDETVDGLAVTQLLAYFEIGLPDVNAKQAGGVPITATTSITFPAACTVATTTGAVGSVTGAVGSVAGLTASNLDATISSRMASYTQPTGFLAATFPGTVASTTNITAGTMTTVTNLTNAPTAGDLTATMKTSVTTAATAATPTAAAVTGSVGGDVAGKVLGGGAGTITATGVWAKDWEGEDLAPAAALAAITTKLGGITLLKNWLAVIMGKTADTGTRAEVNATTAGAGYNETTDSQEAIRDRGDAAWTGGGGGGGTVGPGSIEWDVTVKTTGGDPIGGVQVWVSTDADGDNVIAGTLTTDNFGIVTFMLDAGSYYVWQQRAGYDFSNPTSITVA